MISISKIKNKTASRKNRREKGSRAFERGENPHSKGDAKSRSLVAVCIGDLMVFSKRGRAMGIAIAIHVAVTINIIKKVRDKERSIECGCGCLLHE